MFVQPLQLNEGFNFENENKSLKLYQKKNPIEQQIYITHNRIWTKLLFESRSVSISARNLISELSLDLINLFEKR